MPAPAIGLRPRVTPPATARVDWSHPLAQGLLFAFSPAHEVDWSGQTTFTRVGGSTSIAGTAFGVGRVSDAAAGTGWSCPASRFPSQAGGTIFAATSAAVTATSFLWDSQGDRFTFYTLGTSGHFLANTADVDTGVIPQGHRTIAQSCDGTTMTGFYDGNRVVSTALTPGTRTGLGYLLTPYTGSSNWRGAVAVFLGWSRALSAANHAALHANPFCFLRW